MSFGNSVRADSYSKFVVLLIGVSGLDWWFSEVKTGWSMHQNNNMKGGHSGQQTSWRHANPRLHSVICAVKTKEGGWFLCGVEYRLGVYLRHPQTGKGIREEEEDLFFFFFGLVWMKSCHITFRTSIFKQKSMKVMMSFYLFQLLFLCFWGLRLLKDCRCFFPYFCCWLHTIQNKRNYWRWLGF